MAADLAATMLNADGLFASLLFIIVGQRFLDDREALCASP